MRPFMRSITRAPSCALVPLLGVVLGGVGCITQDAPDDVGSGKQEIGPSCGSNNPSFTVTGGFATAHVSAQTYSDCYKGKIVQIDNYDQKYAIGGHTKVAWADTLPSRADCAGSSVGAYLFRQRGDVWEHVISKSAHGDLIDDDIPSDMVGPPRQPVDAPTSTAVPTPVPKDPGIFGPPVTTRPACRPPVVYLHTSDMAPGGNYKIVASARLPGAVTRKVSFTSVASSCGQTEGDQCCTGGEPCGPWLNCNGTTKTCESCGPTGKQCCTRPLQGVCKDNWTVCGDNDMCSVCGGAGEQCCNENCKGDLKCQSNNVCKAPPPPCGGKDQACCSGTPCNSSDLSCQSERCKTKPTPQPQPQPSCTQSVFVTVKECFNVDGTPSAFYTPNSLTTWGCGPSVQDARNNAALSLASVGFGCIKDNPIPGCCTYSVQNFSGCFCQ